MKTLYLIRHAKSSWKDSRLSDLERPLNKRGKRDAPFMAKLMQQQNEKPEVIISSPANRALTTAKIFSEDMHFPFDDMIVDPKLYMADRHDFLEVLRNINESVNSVMLFSHNPGLTDFSNYISDKELDNIPTCGIVKLSMDKDSWRDLDESTCELILFDYPKKYFKTE